MIHFSLDGDAISNNIPSLVKASPLNVVIGPSEFLVGTVTPTKLADLSTATGQGAEVTIENKAAFTIFFCLGTPGTPALTTANGVELLSSSFLTLDDIGGLCVWAISGTVQSAGSGTRVSGGFVV